MLVLELVAEHMAPAARPARDILAEVLAAEEDNKAPTADSTADIVIELQAMAILAPKAGIGNSGTASGAMPAPTHGRSQQQMV